MSNKINIDGVGNCLHKIFQGKEVLLQKGFDLKHGYGWFCFINGGVGFGFSRKSKFRAVKMAIKDLGEQIHPTLYP